MYFSFFAPGKPREAVRTWGTLKYPIFLANKCFFLTRFFDDFPDLGCLDFFSIVLAAKPYLRCWNPSMSSKTSSNAYFDRLPMQLFKILSATAGKSHFFSSSAVLLQRRSKSWKLSREPVEAAFSWKIRVKLKISVYNFLSQSWHRLKCPFI